MRGGEKCLEIVCRHFPQASLHCLLVAPETISPAIRKMNILTSPLQRIPGIRRYYRYMLPLMPWAVQQLKIDEDVDLVLSFSHAVAKNIQVPPNAIHVCYCFTPMRYAWDCRDQYFGPEGPLASARPFWKRALDQYLLNPLRNEILDRICEWDRKVSHRVSHFVAISETTADRIKRCYNRTSKVIYPPVDTNFYTPRHAMQREDFYLCVSALVPYKRIDLAIQASQKMGRQLIIIGEGSHRLKLERIAGPQVKFLHWRSNEEIRSYLRRCRALLFPGLEDFGIVPVEAQACGTPVIAYRRGGVSETLLAASGERKGTGVFFDQQSPESLVRAMSWLEHHSDRLAGNLARKNALRFQEGRFEAQLLNFLEQVTGRVPSGFRLNIPLSEAG
ncbi:MAG: glycosyl transferase [Planctomycetaceae bacterium]|nr:glycosyl transferase [Planctomycetaceae bacterium]MBP61399.1 glycosyl transferase [Planctomycetaceae bacterium]